MNNLKFKEGFLDNIPSNNEKVDNDKGWMNIISSVQAQTNALSSKKDEKANTFKDDQINENVLNPNYYLKNAVESNLLNLNLKQCKNCHKPFKLQDYNEHRDFVKIQ